MLPSSPLPGSPIPSGPLPSSPLPRGPSPSDPAAAAPSSTAPIPAWAPLKDRLLWVKNFRRLLASREKELTALAEAEVARPRFEAVMSDLLPLLAACRWLEKRAPALLAPRRIRSTPWWLSGTRIIEERAPLGTVAIIATWNYPIQLLGIEMVQALAAGNRVIVKPSENAPKTQLRLLELAIEAGLPPMGVLDWTQPTREAGAELLAEHASGLRRFDHVLFTGSTPVGREIAQALAPTLTPCTLELSGRDSAFVLEDADPVKAARAIWAAVTINHGQTCMGPRRALVHQSVDPDFVSTLRTLAAKAPVRRLINDAAADTFQRLVSTAIADGGQDAAGPNAPALRDGTSVRATAIIDCPMATPLVEGRHFAPALAVLPVPTLSYALSLHRRCDQHLTASIFTKDIASARALAPELGATNVTINDVILPTAHPAVSIGGRGDSGWGLSRGVEGLLAMTRPVYVSTGKHGVARVLDTPGPRMAGMVTWVLMRLARR